MNKLRNSKGQFKKSYKHFAVYATILLITFLGYKVSTIQADEYADDQELFPKIIAPVQLDQIYGISTATFSAKTNFNTATVKDYPYPEATKSADSIEEKIKKVFGKHYEEAILIFKCESGLRANATGHNTNGSTDSGIAQINSVHKVSERYLLNPDINLLVAKQIYDAQGWNPWVCAHKLGIVK